MDKIDIKEKDMKVAPENLELIRKLDTAVYATSVHMYSISKGDEKIILRDFHWENLSHRAIFHIALLTSHHCDFKVYVQCGLRDFAILKHEYDKSAFKWYPFGKKGTSCDTIISRIEKLMEEVGIFKQIYEEFYVK